MGAKLRHVDLFSGIGGFSKGLEDTGGFETVAFVEREPFCQAVLRKHWPSVPCHDDVRTFDAAGTGHVDIVTGGFPCQPVSHAGQRNGKDDDRWLWPEMVRVVAACRPRWVIGENVFGLISLGLDEVLFDLEGFGYTCWPAVIPACAVDASHRRDRVWIVAHTGGQQHEGAGDAERRSAATEFPMADTEGWRGNGPLQPSEREAISGALGPSEAHGHANGQGEPAQPLNGKMAGMPGDVADAPRIRSDGAREAGAARSGAARGRGGKQPVSDPRCGSSQGQGPGQRGSEAPARWLSEPPVGRVAHGIPRRVDRLRALGNAVVPQVVTALGHAILQAEASA